MKKAIVILFIVSVIAPLSWAQSEKEVKGPLTRVTVYPDRAQFIQEAPIEIQQGKTTLVLRNLSPYVDAQSIQVKGTGEFTILSVNHQNNFLKNLEERQDIKDIRAQIESLQAKVEDEKAAISVLEKKEGFLDANIVITPKDAGITADQYKQLLEIYTSNSEQITVFRLKKQRLVKEYEKQIAALQQQIAGISVKEQLPSGEIAVTVSSDKPVTGKLSCTYVVMNAGWYPSYDIRVDEISKPVTIVYKANVFQNTGVEWKNVKLSFSTATPWLAGDVPVLDPWFIDFYYPAPPRTRSAASKKSEEMPMVAMEKEVLADRNTIMREPQALMATVEKKVGEMSVTFDAALPYTILSDGKVQTVEIQRSVTPADYRYVTVPKSNDKAYLTGNITDWASQNLMSGEANLYFENTFVGKSGINVNQLTDTLTLSLGVDNSILVKREKRKDFTSKKTIGANKTETYSFLLTIRNNKTNAVKIKVNDQIPVSSNSSITVEPSELSGGKLEVQTGKISWDLELKPQEKKELVLTYSVKYPKNMTVILE